MYGFELREGLVRLIHLLEDGGGWLLQWAVQLSRGGPALLAAPVIILFVQGTASE